MAGRFDGEYCEHCWDFKLWVPKRPISNCPRCMLREWPERSIDTTDNQSMKYWLRDALLDAGIVWIVTVTLAAFLVVCWVYAA